MSNVSGSLDANVILRLLLNDIPTQHKAVLNLLGESSNRFILADIAVIEVVFVLERHYTFTRPQILRAIMGLSQLPQIISSQSFFEKALLIFSQNNTLSFEDCCLAVRAELENAQPLWTFDKDLAKRIPGVKVVLTQ